MLRDYLNRSWDGSQEELFRALDIVTAYRASFQGPLTKTAVGVRQFVQRESDEVIVAQRLKRLPTILDKLVRMPKTNLARLEDIGGCRAVLPGGRPEIDGVLRRIRRNWDVIRERDYMDEPKSTGYRAVHVAVERDGRRLEIQLRTQGQQDWAEMVERIDGRLGTQLKDGVGPPDLQRYLQLAGQGVDLAERGIEPDSEFETEFAEVRGKALRLLQGEVTG
jgi:ppGpp synthetase/RelA/SpoT-type nucleotidyltranferase